MLSLEHALQEKGLRKIAGVDEAGRGPLAGPVVAAAVILSPGEFSAEITDSKRLSPKKRLAAYEEILSTCSVGVGIASVETDRFNILRPRFWPCCGRWKTCLRYPDFCLVDGPHPIRDLKIMQQPVVAR